MECFEAFTIGRYQVSGGYLIEIEFDFDAQILKYYENEYIYIYIYFNIYNLRYQSIWYLFNVAQFYENLHDDILFK